MPRLVDPRFHRHQFMRSVAHGETLARQLSPSITERLKNAEDIQAELSGVVAEFRALGHPLEFEQSDSTFQSWVDVDTENALALFLDGELDPTGRPVRIDRVEVLWYRT
ncbi:MAG TPA: hypothetical protein VK539_00380 [Myxococcaceae bacterium]|nr:hypothetical protein [Myxococcaceae bacterium]